MVSWTISSISYPSSHSASSGWYWQGQTLTEAPQDAYGFVYVIHNPQTARYYIGQKQFWTIKKLPPLKGKVNRRHRKVESDWKDYWGSSDALHQDLDNLGKHCFVRVIVAFASSKGELNYLETKAQFERDVLLDPLSYNGIINCKIHRSHLSKLT